MSDQTASTAVISQKQKVHLPPFEIEFATYNSTSVMYPLLGNKKFRGRWSRTKLDGMEMSLGRNLAMMPDIPGLRIRFIPKERRLVVHDPLEDTPELLEQITNITARANIGFHKKFKPVPKSEQVLDADMFLTLLLCMRRNLDGPKPNFIMVSGEFPTMEQINALDGEELNEPGSVYYKGPKYKKDLDRQNRLLEAMAEKGIVI